MNFQANCPRGLEQVLADELGALGAVAVEPGHAHVRLRSDAAGAMRINRHSRIAGRLLWHLAGGEYRREDDIYAAAHALPWTDWFSPAATIKVHTQGYRSPLRSMDFITLRIKDALCDRFRAQVGRRPSVDAQRPDVRVYAYLHQQRFDLFLDTSGEPLWQRGYRAATAAAPLKENLAAGLLALAGWNGQGVLLDPFCGGGTIAIEAALLAAGRAPGAGRRFGFEKLVWFDRPAWRELEQQAPASGSVASVFASDASAAALEMARANARQAGVSINFEKHDAIQRRAPGPLGLLLTNLPYGKRSSDEASLAALYPRLGDQLKREFAGWRCAFFTADRRFEKLLGLATRRRSPVFNGALECRLYALEVYAGSSRAGKFKESQQT
jgi:putative N6-adenine-specific DNA methylase